MRPLQLLLIQLFSLLLAVSSLQQQDDYNNRPECVCFTRPAGGQQWNELFCQNKHAFPPDSQHAPVDSSSRQLRGAEFKCADIKLSARGFDIGAIEGELAKSLLVAKFIKWVDLSSNQLALLTQSHFASLPSLQRLELQRNAIREVNHRAFDNLRLLFYLDFDENLLTEVTTQTFGTNSVNTPGNSCNLKSLQYLFLANNQIERIEPHSFECMTNLREFNLQKNRIKILLANAFSSLGSLHTLKLYGNQIHQVAELAFADCCTELRYFSLVDNRLASLPREIFKAMSNLTSLYLDRNQFVHIPNYLLTYVDSRGPSKLLDVHLQRNHIVQIRYEDFRGVGRIDSINLFDNNIQRIEDYSFSSLSHTTNLVLQKNELRSVSQRTFAGLVRLRYLILTDNRLEEIGDYAFKPLGRLDTLSLAANRLTGLRRLMFMGLNYTFALNLASNYIQSLQGDNFDLMPGLKYLYLEKNSLTHLRVNYFHGLGALKKLDLSDNRIHTIDPLAFKDLKQLAFLDLSGNTLVTVCSSALYGLESLHSLLLSKSSVASIDPDALDQLGALNLLDLHDNSLTEFSTGLSGNRMQISYLDLSGNHLLLDDCTFCGLDNVRYANIGVAPTTTNASGALLNLEQLRGLNPWPQLDITVNGARLTPHQMIGLQPCMPTAIAACRIRHTNRLVTLKNRACYSNGDGRSAKAADGESSGTSVTLNHVVLYVSLPALLLLLIVGAVVLGLYVSSRRRNALRRRQFQQRRIWEPDTNLLELNTELSSSSSEMPKFSNKIYGNLLL